MSSLSYVHSGGESPLIGLPIHAYLREVSVRHADHDAVVSIPQNVRLSYGELFDRADRLARGLLALGIGRGDRVGIWATDKNRPSWPARASRN